MSACKTQLVRDAAEVPVGFMRVKDITDNLRERQALYNAHALGRIEARKRMVTPADQHGTLWVSLDAAHEVLRSYRERMELRNNPQRHLAVESEQPAVLEAATSSAPAIQPDAAVAAIYQLAEEVRNLRRVLQAVGRAGVDEVGA